MEPNPDVTDFATVRDAMLGCTVSGGEECVDGIHLNFEDGRVLIISGDFVIALCRVEKRRTH